MTRVPQTTTVYKSLPTLEEADLAFTDRESVQNEAALLFSRCRGFELC